MPGPRGSSRSMLPGLPLLQLIGNRGLDEISLFHLLAAGTFYGIACGQLRWKSLGYAAAVLYNAALWVLWSRLGWKLSTHPQFFLVPVGLSTILFAEVNRRELGRSNVNTIRTVGLTIIYLSLAVPIWQYESFGAWVTLLIGSLVGRLPGDRPAAPDVSLDGPHDVRSRRGLRDGPREPGLRTGQVGDHACPGHRAGDVRGAQREEADRRHDAALF